MTSPNNPQTPKCNRDHNDENCLNNFGKRHKHLCELAIAVGLKNGL